MFPEPGLIEFGEITLAGVGKEGDDEGIPGKGFGDFPGPGGGGATGGTAENSLLAGDFQGGLVRGFVGNRDDFVDVVPPDAIGNEILTKAIGEILVDVLRRGHLTVLLEKLEDTSLDVDANNPNFRVFFLEEFGRSADGPAGSDAGHPVVACQNIGS